MVLEATVADHPVLAPRTARTDPRFVHITFGSSQVPLLTVPSELGETGQQGWRH